jgi:hypothetical protein
MDNPLRSHEAFMLLAGQFIFVGVLAFVAGNSDQAGDMIILFLLGLWFVFIIFNSDAVLAFAKRFGIGGF